MDFENFELKINDTYFQNIKKNLLESRDSFDNEIYKLITKFGKIKSIELPDLSREERYKIHSYERTNIYFYSIDSGEEFSKMKIVIKTPYLTTLKKKYKVDIDSLTNSFKTVLIADITELINERFSNFKI